MIQTFRSTLSNIWCIKSGLMNVTVNSVHVTSGPDSSITTTIPFPSIATTISSFSLL